MCLWFQSKILSNRERGRVRGRGRFFRFGAQVSGTTRTKFPSSSGSADSLAKGRSVRFRNVIVFFLGFALVGACCAAFAILIGKIKHASELKLAAAQKADQIIDIWINRTQGSFFVFLPDNTARIYESYSFDLINAGKWQKVEDRPIYPESPSIGLPSYKAEFDGARVAYIYLYPIFHHDSIVIEDKIIGHRGF